jgi:hypothetical protein
VIVVGYEREKLKDYIATLGITTPITYTIYDTKYLVTGTVNWN